MGAGFGAGIANRGGGGGGGFGAGGSGGAAKPIGFLVTREERHILYHADLLDQFQL